MHKSTPTLSNRQANLEKSRQLHQESLLNQNVAFEKVKEATGGTAANIMITLNKECDDPRPLGDQIIFYSPTRENSSHSTSKDYKTLSYNLSNRLADELRMLNKLPSYQVSLEEINELSNIKQWLERRSAKIALGIDDPFPNYYNSVTILDGSSESLENSDELIEYQDQSTYDDMDLSDHPLFDENKIFIVKADTGIYCIYLNILYKAML